MSRQDIAVRIVGYIRQAAIGDPLVTYEQRGDRTLQELLETFNVAPWAQPVS